MLTAYGLLTKVTFRYTTWQLKRNLTFKKTGQHLIRCTIFLFESQNTVLQWTFKVTSALATAENLIYKRLYAEG
jgi:hypothetical protein